MEQLLRDPGSLLVGPAIPNKQTNLHGVFRVVTHFSADYSINLRLYTDFNIARRGRH